MLHLTIREPRTVGFLHQGDIRETKSFLGIKDAQYDQDTKEMNIPANLTLSGNDETLNVGEYVVKEEGLFVIYTKERLDAKYNVE